MEREDADRLVRIEEAVIQAGVAGDSPHDEASEKVASKVTEEARGEAAEAVSQARTEAASAVAEARHEAAQAVSEARHEAAAAVTEARVDAAAAVADAKIEAESTMRKMHGLLSSAKWFIVVAVIAFFVVYLAVR